MGFSEIVEGAEPAKYRQYYLNYRELKDLIVELANELTSQRSRFGSRDFLDNERALPAGRFQERLQAELRKVNQFACVKHEDLFLSLRRLCEECKSLGKEPSDIAAMSSRIEALSEEVVYLDTYVRRNYTGFMKLTQKFDLYHGVSGSGLFIANLQAEPFANVRFDDILILLGLAWARWRDAQREEQSKDATWKPPESFIRNTAKYWVKPDKVVLLKTRILKELPYLIFGASVLEQEKLLEPFALLGAGMDVQSAMSAYSGTMEESQLLSSVYFDSPDAKCYQERIRREEGARLVRFRWYGENNQEANKEIYVERKIHHEGWGSASSAKERAIVPQSEIFNFMKGRLNIDDYFSKLAKEGAYSEKSRKAMKKIAVEVNEMIQDKKMQPIVRTSYYRCAFQLSTSNDVRISLDTQMTLLNEFVDGGHPTEPWHRISTDFLGEQEVYRFPFAILEIKLQNVTETPRWLRQTLADIEATQVHKFSKFQHGMAFLHPERVPILPHWHKDFQEWGEQRARAAAEFPRRRIRSNSGRLQSHDSMEEIEVPKLRVMVAPAGEGHFLKDMENLDPKAIFANERTLLHYAEKGMYFGMVAVGLLYRRGPLQVAGGLLAITVVFFYIWALVEYYSRLHRISHRASVAKSSLLRLDLAHGPLVVASITGLVLLLAWAVAEEQ